MRRQLLSLAAVLLAGIAGCQQTQAPSPTASAPAPAEKAAAPAPGPPKCGDCVPVTVDNFAADGFFRRNDLNAYTLNSITANKSADGSVTVQFGGCDGKVPNCLPIVPGWNYMVRLYRPHPEILGGKWKFPEA